MRSKSTPSKARRELIKAVGGTVVLAPFVGLTACSGGDDSSSGSPAPEAPPPRDTGTAGSSMMEQASDAVEQATDAVEEAAEDAAAAVDAAVSEAGGMPRLSEDDPQAKSLNYVHDATTLDASAQPRYKPGQLCSNCALYQARNGEEWGGCSIFPGRLVKGSGWCTVYAPKAG